MASSTSSRSVVMSESNLSVHNWLNTMLHVRSRHKEGHMWVDDLAVAPKNVKWAVIGNVLASYDIDWRTPRMPSLIGASVAHFSNNLGHGHDEKRGIWPQNEDLVQMKRWLLKLDVGHLINSANSSHEAYIRLLLRLMSQVERKVGERKLRQNVLKLAVKHPKRAKKTLDSEQDICDQGTSCQEVYNERHSLTMPKDPSVTEGGDGPSLSVDETRAKRTQLDQASSITSATEANKEKENDEATILAQSLSTMELSNPLQNSSKSQKLFAPCSRNEAEMLQDETLFEQLSPMPCSRPTLLSDEFLLPSLQKRDQENCLPSEPSLSDESQYGLPRLGSLISSGDLGPSTAINALKNKANNATFFEDLSPLPQKPSARVSDAFHSTRQDAKRKDNVHNETLREVLAPMPQDFSSNLSDAFHDTRTRDKTSQAMKNVLAQRHVDDIVTATPQAVRSLKDSKKPFNANDVFAVVAEVVTDQFHST